MPEAPTNKTPAEVTSLMLENDRFSKWLGLEIEETGVGYCRLHYRITADMINGFHTVHGGIIFSAADSAFAFACNSHGILSVAHDVSITFTKAGKIGDLLTVEAKELHLGKRTGLYEVKTTNADGQLVALFKGTSFRTSTHW